MSLGVGAEPDRGAGLKGESFAMLSAVGILLVLAGCAASAPAPTATELVRQIAELRADQQTLRLELAEVRKLLAARQAATGPAPTLAEPVDISGLPVKGDARAPVTVIELTDYQCPYCRRHAEGAFPQIEREYVKSGKVRYAILDLPLAMHRYAPKAAEAAHCAAEQGKFWEMHDALFADQGALATEDLRQRAAALGIDTAAFDACLQSGTYAARVADGAAEAARLGVTGTPTFLIGRTAGDKVTDIRVIRGAQPFASFKSGIDGLLNGGSVPGQ
jgi:protein-disulfide isomerase